ncbi:site-2 protease family protein [Patescibacteria group bacterium]|nr:site-2 protease family protein [Patescibacteria group bacterium]
MQTDLIFGLIILIISVILHEVAHGYMANYLGDPTARLQGRLTLNPLSHIDPIGSILLPALLVFSSSPFLIGYAKPVPYNPYNLKGKWAETLVAAAGPGTNLLLACIFAILIRAGSVAMTTQTLTAFATIVYINLLLALFNLIPIAPLDGSKVLSGLLGTRTVVGRAYESFRSSLERVGVFSGTLIILVILYLLYPYFSFVVQATFTLLVGQ